MRIWGVLLAVMVWLSAAAAWAQEEHLELDPAPPQQPWIALVASIVLGVCVVAISLMKPHRDFHD